LIHSSLLLFLNIVNDLLVSEHKRLRNPNLLNRLHHYEINNLIKFDDKLPYGVKINDQTEF